MAFGPVKTRLGSIKYDQKKRVSLIRINGLLRAAIIPEEIIFATLVHETVHYMHGYGSSLPQKHPHPHASGVLVNELRSRGLHDTYRVQKKWLKEHWPAIAKAHFPLVRRRRLVRVRYFKI